jgi:hypothetical protein
VQPGIAVFESWAGHTDIASVGFRGAVDSSREVPELYFELGHACFIPRLSHTLFSVIRLYHAIQHQLLSRWLSNVHIGYVHVKLSMGQNGQNSCGVD